MRNAIIQFETDAEPSDCRTVATGVFVVNHGLASNPITTLQLSLPFTIQAVGEFVVESAVLESHGNTSLALRRTSDPQDTIFLAGFVWNTSLNPYFGVRLPEGGMINIYLQSSLPAGKRGA